MSLNLRKAGLKESVDDYRCSGDIRIENVPYAWMIIKVVSVERGVGCKCVQLFFCFLKICSIIVFVGVNL